MIRGQKTLPFQDLLVILHSKIKRRGMKRMQNPSFIINNK